MGTYSSSPYAESESGPCIRPPISVSYVYRSDIHQTYFRVDFDCVNPTIKKSCKVCHNYVQPREDTRYLGREIYQHARRVDLERGENGHWTLSRVNILHSEP